MAATTRFVKGFAGICTTGSIPAPWTDNHLGQPVASHSLKNGRIWTFGSAIATWETVDGTFFIAGRPFDIGDGSTANAQNTGELGTLLSELDGRFSLCCQLPDGDVAVATDWLGLGPLFLAEFHGAVYFASHLGLLLDLLDELPPIDQLGVTSLLAGCTMIGGRTPYQGIRRLMAGEMASIDVRGPVRLSVQRYADPAEVLSSGRVDSADVDDQFDHLFAAAVRREGLERSRSALLLSGGRDSRALAYMLAEQEHESPPAVTFGRRSSYDMRMARRRAAELRLSHSCIPYDKWTLHGEAPFVADLGGGASGLQAAHFTVPFRRLAQCADVAITGFMGDATTGAHLNGPSYDHVALCRLPGWRAPFAEVYAEELSALRSELALVDAVRSDLAPHQRTLLVDFTIRQATWISQSFSLCSWYTDVSAPFVHRGLVSFLFNLPKEHLAKQALYDRWLARKGEALERSGRVVSTITERAIGLTLFIDRAICKGLGVGSPASVVNWPKMYRGSRESFEGTLEAFHEDDRLHTIAAHELDTLRHVRRRGLSPLLFALPIMQARTDRTSCGKA